MFILLLSFIMQGHTDILNDPLVKTMCTNKWQRFALAQFVTQGLCYLVYVIVQTFLIWLHCSGAYWNTRHRAVCLHQPS